MRTGEQNLPHGKELVLLIHGTNAADPADTGDHWWQRESEFWRRLSQNLGDNYVCQPIGHVFHWSGLNSEKHRRAAATELAEHIVRLEDAKVTYHLIGHSHGGSVIWRALRLAIAARPELSHLKSWSTIGTPFLHYAPTALSWWWFATFVCASISLGIAAPQARSYLEVIGEALHDPSGALLPLLLLPLFWILPAGFLAILFIRIGILVHTSARTARERSAAETTYNALWRRYVALWCEVDEAIGGLASTLGFKGAIVPRMRTVSSSVVGYLLFIFGLPVRAIYNGVFAPASDEFIWDRITRRLQGNDQFGYDMVRVTRGPMPSFPLWPELPRGVSEQLIKTANDHAASTLAAVRNVLGLAASSNSELPSLVTAIGAQIQNRELVHTLYYANKDVCDLLTLHIARGIPETRILSQTAPSMIGAWLESGSAASDPAIAAGGDPVVESAQRRQQTGLLPAIQSVTVSSILILAVLAASAVYTAVVRPYSEHYQLEYIANQDIMARVISGPDISEGVLGQWATSVTRAGFEDHVLSAAAQLDRMEKRQFVLAIVTHELLKEGKSEKAQSVIDSALTLVKTSSPNVDDHGFRAVAEELAHIGRVQDALAVVDALSPDRDDWKADGLRQIATGQADAGNPDDALVTLNRISNLEARAREYQDFIRDRLKDDPARRKAIDALLLLAPDVPDEHNWRSGSLSAIASDLIDLGESDHGLQVARSIPTTDFRAGALTRVADALIQSGKYDAADAIINEALAAKPQGGTGMAVALAQLGRLAHRADARDKAGKLLDAALVAARKERFFREISIGSVAAAWAQLGDAEKCMAVLAEKPTGFYKESSFEPIESSMMALATLGLAEDASKIANSITEPNRKSLTLLALALTYDEAKRRVLLLQVEKLIESITDETDQSFARSKVAEAWAQMNQFRYALRLSEGTRSFDRIRVQQVILNRYIEREKLGMGGNTDQHKERDLQNECGWSWASAAPNAYPCARN